MQMADESAGQAVIGKVKMFQLLLFLDQAGPDLAELSSSDSPLYSQGF